MRALLLLAAVAALFVPMPAHATVPSECGARALKATFGPVPGAAGMSHVYGGLRLTNVSTGACWVQGYGGLSFVGHRGGKQVGAAAARTPSAHPNVIIAPGDSVLSSVSITTTGPYDPATCRPTAVAGFRVFPPDSRVSTFVPFATTTCANRSLVMLQHKAFRRPVGRL